MAAQSRHLSAQEACDLLGVTAATLYAYVSRGLIRSEPVEGDHRARRYSAEDVAALQQRKEQRRNPAKVAQQALHWGTPVLESALTLISDDRLYYRGYEATQLALTRSLEEVAWLMWTGRLETPPKTTVRIEAPVEPLSGSAEWSFAQRFYVALALAAERDLNAYQLASGPAAETGLNILRLMTAVLAEGDADERDIATQLTARWCSGDPGAQRLMSAALVLCVDHELSASSFTARVVASAASNPYRVVIAGLAALEGARHGGVLNRVRALLREVGTPEQAHDSVRDWLRRGEPLPGFGHHLYPNGDPRAQLLLDLLREGYAGTPPLALGAAIAAAARELTGLEPTVDFALMLLEQCLELPRGASVGLFALGRAAGWIAHAIEQYAVQPMIRPRAKYVGPPPRRSE